MKASDKSKTFEVSLSELENIVRKLEDGDLSLEESLKLFETGVRLSRECQERLDQAERRIEILLKDADGNLALQPIGGGEETGEEEREPRVKRRIVFNNDEDDATF